MKSFARAVVLRHAALVFGLIASVSVARADYIETWSNGTTEGWGSVGSNLFSDNPGSGGNPGGWLRGVRGANPIFSWSTGSGGAFNGNWNTLFGTQLTLSYDLFIEDGGSNELRMVLRNSSGTTDWRYDWVLGTPQVNANGWVPYSAPIDTTWTDAQAAANGWTLTAGSASWASVLADVGPDSFLVSLTGSSPPPVGSAHSHGIDNFAVTAVPEPSGIVLGGITILCGLGCILQRKRK